MEIKRIVSFLFPLIFIRCADWPGDPKSIDLKVKEEINVDAFLIAGNPLESLWVTKTFTIEEGTGQMRYNPVYDSIFITLTNTLTGKIDTLQSYDSLPNTFFGHDTVQTLTTYGLYLFVLRKGKTQADTLRAYTTVPGPVRLDSLLAPKVSDPAFFQGPGDFNSFFEAIPDTQRIILLNQYYPLKNNDTLMVVKHPDFPFLYYYLFPSQPQKARGLAASYSWQGDSFAMPYNASFGFRDSTAFFEKSKVGINLLILDKVLPYPDTNKTNDVGSLFRGVKDFEGFSIPLVANLLLGPLGSPLRMLGRNVIYLYAIDSAWYLHWSSEDLRDEPLSNIQGGRGVFASATVDSIIFYLKDEANSPDVLSINYGRQIKERRRQDSRNIFGFD